MIAKEPINLNRIRKVPKQFSWLDQRLVRDRHIDRLSLPAAAFYLFLVTVCDAKGLSYWSDAAVMQRLSAIPPRHRRPAGTCRQPPAWRAARAAGTHGDAPARWPAQ